MLRSIDNNYVYLDYAATSPLSEEAYNAMLPHLEYGRDAVLEGANPNSLSTPGRIAFRAMEAARKDVAQAIGASRPDEVVFTSGATESDNAALFGLAQAAIERRRLEKGASKEKPEVVVSAIEHDAVINAAKSMRQSGYEVKFINPDRDGFIEVSALEKAIGPNTILVSVQMANSETGAVQPIRQLAEAAHASGALFHTDATQALGKVPVDVRELGVDAASFSSHKVGGPKGVGALYISHEAPFAPSIFGGGQEAGRRSGTQNVCGAAGFAAACKYCACAQPEEWHRLAALRDKLYAGLALFEQIQPTVEVEPLSQDYLPNIVNVMVSGLESETLVLRFDSLGFAVSGGSACSSSSLEASHVLSAMGIRSDDALGELRISLGRYTTEEDIEGFLACVPKVLSWE